MKILIAQLATETNTFAAFPTGLGAFEEYGIFHGDASRKAPTTSGDFLLFLRNLMEADGHQVVESLCAFCQPAGRTVKRVYEDLRDSLLRDAQAAMPLDAVQLFLHGAMVADGYDDCEGDLLARIREIVGPDVPIGVELDLHCHFTELMRRSADVLICFKEYPHTDGIERAREVYKIVLDGVAGKVSPTTAVADCKLVGLWHTTREPMMGFVQRMRACEGKDGVLSVSVGHGFPWVTYRRPDASCGWSPTTTCPRHKPSPTSWPVSSGTFVCRPAPAPPVSTRRSTRRSPPKAARSCSAMSPTTRVAVRLGTAPSSSNDSSSAASATRSWATSGTWGQFRSARTPVSARWSICASVASAAPRPATRSTCASPCARSRTTTARPAFESRAPLGTAVWVEADNDLHIVMATVRSQVFGCDAFTGLGLTLDDKKVVAVKSTQHFHAQFLPIAKKVLYVSTPGALTSDFADIPYQARSLDYRPRVEHPAGF